MALLKIGMNSIISNSYILSTDVLVMNFGEKLQTRWRDQRSKLSTTRKLELNCRRRQQRRIREKAKSIKESPVSGVGRQTSDILGPSSSPSDDTHPENCSLYFPGSRNHHYKIKHILAKMGSRKPPLIHFGHGIIFGGKERCRAGKDYDCYNANYKDTMDYLQKEDQGIRWQLRMGNDHTYSVLDQPVLAVGCDGISSNSLAFLAIHISHLENVVVDKDTISGGWITRWSSSFVPSSKSLNFFLNQTGSSGVPLRSIFPTRSTTQQETIRKGQTNFDNGFMIGAMPNNAKSWTCDADGCRLPSNEFHAVRGAMGVIGGKAHMRALELLSPCAPIADRLFHAWTVKLQRISACAKRAFDGSRRLTYTTILLTVGNETKDAEVLDTIKKNGLESYLLDNAGKYIHVDRLNTTKSPCVTITVGAYDGFRFCFPTLNTEIHAPSGTAIIGTFDSLLHAVGAGTGVRISLVYCQHEEIVRGRKEHKNNNVRVLTGARKSLRDTPGKVPIIRCLSLHDYK
jgi:hypothetical protein